MKIIITFLVSAILSSCANHSSREINRSSDDEVISQSVNFKGPMNDLFPEFRKVGSGYNTSPVVFHGQLFVHRFPLTQAVQCNISKSECKHAVINTRLEFTAQLRDDRQIEINGILHTEMGRSFTVSDTNYGSTMSQSITLPDSVPLIGELKTDLPFQKVLHFGEALELTGLADVHVVVEFQLNHSAI